MTTAPIQYVYPANGIEHTQICNRHCNHSNPIIQQRLLRSLSSELAVAQSTLPPDNHAQTQDPMEGAPDDLRGDFVSVLTKSVRGERMMAI